MAASLRAAIGDKRRRRLSLSLCVFLSLVSILTACGSASPSRDGFLTREEYREALSKTLSESEWPPNYEPSVDRIVERTYPKEGVVQEGMNLTINSIFLICAWSLEFMDGYRSGGSEPQQAALSHFKTYIPTVPGLSEDMQELSFRLATHASIGDIEEMTGFLKANCYPLDWLENPVAGPPQATHFLISSGQQGGNRDNDRH